MRSEKRIKSDWDGGKNEAERRMSFIELLLDSSVRSHGPPVSASSVQAGEQMPGDLQLVGVSRRLCRMLNTPRQRSGLEYTYRRVEKIQSK